MRSMGFQNFQQCCFRQPDWWSNSTHWMGRLLLVIFSLQWRHNEPDSVSNNQFHDCLLNRLFRRRSKKTSKLRVTAFVRGIHRWPVNSPTKGQWRGKCFHLMTSSCDDSPWFLLPHDSPCRPFPLNFTLSCSENVLVPQKRIITIFSQNKPIFKQKMSLKMVSAKYRPFVRTVETYTISLETCTWIGCALFCCGHNIIDSRHTFYWLVL